MLLRSIRRKAVVTLCVTTFMLSSASGQTDIDFDMMSKNLFCTGISYSYGSWNQYWEGTRKRENLNIGTISTQSVSIMGNYGISRKVNLLFGLPYVRTKASAGTLRGLDGLQDLSLFVKYRPISYQVGQSKLSLLAVGGFSFPVSNYVADHQPLSIGFRSRNLIGRLIADYQLGKFSVTGSGTYVHRSNITIDRNAYYTTRLHLTDEVYMPDMTSFNLRTGYRSKWLRAEAVFTRFITLGGFDITRNNMPFPSNRMNGTQAGLALRYVPRSLPNLSITAEGTRVLDGRNIGQSTIFSGGVFYIFDFSKKSESSQQKTAL